MPDDPRYIPPAERAEGEPGEGGYLRTDAEEWEAAESAPEILEFYRARVREAEEAVNPPPDQPWPTQAAADLMALGKWPPPSPTRAPLKAHFDQACRRGKWLCFGFSEVEDRRVPVRSPWRGDLNYGVEGEMTGRNGRAYSEVLFYQAGAKAAPGQSDEGAVSTKKKKPAPAAAAMVAWYDALTPSQRKKTPNALADLYVNEDPGSREKQHRHACTVFAKPSDYRGRG